MAKKYGHIIFDFSALCHLSKHSAFNRIGGNMELLRPTIAHGVMQQVYKVLEQHRAPGARVSFACDSRTSFRKNAYPNYKHGRHDNQTQVDLDCYETFDYIKEKLGDMGFPMYSVEGFEADDIMACVSKWAATVLLVTHDNDLYQTLSFADIYWLGKIKNEAWFKDEYGIGPINWDLVKAAAGCKSDQVEGIKGVGEKTAIKWINGMKVKAISENQQIVERNLPLVTLPHGRFPAQDFLVGYGKCPLEVDNYKLREFMKENKMQTYLNQFTLIEQAFGI